MRQTRFMLALLALLSVGIGLFTVACSDSDRSEKQQPADLATVRFIFDLAAAKSEVPLNVKSFQFIGFSDEAMQKEIAHSPWSAGKDEAKVGEQQVVELKDVPINTVRFRINYLDENAKVVGTYDTEVIALKAGETVEIAVGREDGVISKLHVVFDPAEVPEGAETCDLAVLDAEGKVLMGVSNAKIGEYTFENVDLSAASVAVTYRDVEGRVIATASGDIVDARSGEEYTVYVGAASPVEYLTALHVVFDATKVPKQAENCDIAVLDVMGNVLVSASGVKVGNYTFEDVELTATMVVVFYKNATGKVIATASGSVVDARPDKECTVYIGEASPIEYIPSLTVIFDAKIPMRAETCDIAVLDVMGNVLASVSDVEIENYTFDSVELTAAKVTVTYKNAKGRPIAVASGDVVDARPGEDCNVLVGKAYPVELIAALNVIFDTAQVPEEAVKCDIAILDAEGNVLESVSDADIANCTFENVIALATTVGVTYKNAQGQAIATASGDVEAVEPGEECDVYIGAATPMLGVTIKIVNAYPMEVSTADYQVEYTSSAGTGKIATGKVSYDVAAGVGTCSIIFAPQGDDVAVTNVKLSNYKNGIPFEWLTYDTAQPVNKDGFLTLDVSANSFAGGNGTVTKPYLVGNPRQLQGMSKYCDGVTAFHFKQIRDIDYEGSCGVTVQFSIGKLGQLDLSPNMVDPQARFNVTDYRPRIKKFSYAGCPVIGQDDNEFTGSYDGDHHTIDNMVIYKPSYGCVGMFGVTNACTLSNIVLGEHCTVVGNDGCGALLGVCLSAVGATGSVVIENCSVQGTVAGIVYVGGLVGEAFGDSFTVNNCQVSAVLYGRSSVGGLLGFDGAHLSNNLIESSYSGDIIVFSDGTKASKLTTASNFCRLVR